MFSLSSLLQLLSVLLACRGPTVLESVAICVEAAAVLKNRAAWTAELAKQLENLPSAFRPLLQNPDDDQAMLDALHASLRKREASEDAGDLLSGGLRREAPVAAAAAADVLGGGLGVKRSLLKRKADGASLLGSKPAKHKAEEAGAKRPKPLRLAKVAAGLDLKKGETAARAAQKQQKVDVDAALEFLEFFAAAEEEPSDESRAAAAAHLAALEELSHPKHDVRVPEMLKNWNLIWTLGWTTRSFRPCSARRSWRRSYALKREEPGGHVFDGLLA